MRKPTFQRFSKLSHLLYGLSFMLKLMGILVSPLNVLTFTTLYSYTCELHALYIYPMQTFFKIDDHEKEDECSTYQKLKLQIKYCILLKPDLSP